MTGSGSGTTQSAGFSREVSGRVKYQTSDAALALRSFGSSTSELKVGWGVAAAGLSAVVLESGVALRPDATNEGPTPGIVFAEAESGEVVALACALVFRFAVFVFGGGFGLDGPRVRLTGFEFASLLEGAARLGGRWCSGSGSEPTNGFVEGKCSYKHKNGQYLYYKPYV